MTIEQDIESTIVSTENLLKRISELEADVERLRATIKALEGEISRIRHEELREAQGRCKSLRAEVERLGKLVDDLRSLYRNSGNTAEARVRIAQPNGGFKEIYPAEAALRIEAALAIANESPGPCVDWGERLDRVVEALTGGRE